MVFIRPDRFVAALCSPQEVDATTRALADVMAMPLVAQPAAASLPALAEAA
ncbi:hypothetical protein SM757_23235 [Azohydromonas lata]|uniref:Uncharacterized protein n=1 Tax=Azohydromonas lata TaxID=45677 RepID=A0ABU5IKQ6_9BURK|nr:hypothetical protein [Azohydromonas lata]MDZ5459498.1 hypothetical protein [Azohydromonas lata]